METPFAFFIDDNKAATGESATRTLCAVQTGSGSGNTVPVSEGNYFIFRFGVGFGVLTGFSNPRVQSRNGGAALGTVTIQDFSVEIQPGAGKILFEYEAEETHQLGYLDEICVDAEWTSPRAPTEGIIDLNVTLDPARPTTAILPIFVR